MKKLALVAIALAWAAPLAAQDDEAEVRAVIERMFEAMRQGDSALAATTFHPEARLQNAGMNREGQPVLSTTSIERFLGFIGGLEPGQADEPVWDWEIQIDDALAQVWVKYELIWQGNFSHCGVDAIQLWRSSEGWKIFQVADTRRRDAEGCWHQPESN